MNVHKLKQYMPNLRVVNLWGVSFFAHLYASRMQDLYAGTVHEHVRPRSHSAHSSHDVIIAVMT